MAITYTRGTDDNFYSESGERAYFEQGPEDSEGFQEPTHYPQLGQLVGPADVEVGEFFDGGWNMHCLHATIFDRIETYSFEGGVLGELLSGQDLFPLSEERTFKIPKNSLPDMFVLEIVPQTSLRFEVRSSLTSEWCVEDRWGTGVSHDYWEALCDCPHQQQGEPYRTFYRSSMYKFLYHKMPYKTYISTLVAGGCAGAVVGGILMIGGCVVGAQMQAISTNTARKRRTKRRFTGE